MAVSVLTPLSQQAIGIGDGTHLLLTVVNYIAQNDVLDVDGTAQGPAFFYSLDNPTFANQPLTSAVVGTPGASTAGMCRVTIGAATAGTLGRTLVITRHVGNTSLGTGAGQ